MRVEIRAISRLRGPDPPDVPAALASVLDALVPSDLDLASARVVCDWIQYKASFRDVVEVRPVLPPRPIPAGFAPGGLAAGEPAAGERAAGEAAGAGRDARAGTADGLEIAVDLRRCGESDLAAAVREVLASRAEPARSRRIPLEPWVQASQSCVWRFNTLYWQALSRWEEATGREYEQALPGGRSDARNVGAVREAIFELLRVWDELDARRALPQELYVAELGVGNGNQARTWLDVFAELDRAHGRDYYHRLHYLMGDYSAHVLERARAAVAHHGDRVSSLVLDATRPQITLGFLRGKAFGIYISNVYDNLPCDEVAIIGGRPYLVQVRACLGEADAVPAAARLGVAPDALPTLIGRLLRLGPDLLAEADPARFPSPEHAVGFWREAWAALRLEERYVPLDGLDAYPVAAGLSGEMLRPLLESAGEVRMGVSNGALASFVETLPLLHPFGKLICHDLFVTDPAAYQAGFHGPGKYDGSVVNWVNGPLLALAGNRRGFAVRIEPFRARPQSNVKTLTAVVRD